jgi:Protein of unknown function (DUF3810)
MKRSIAIIKTACWLVFLGFFTFIYSIYYKFIFPTINSVYHATFHQLSIPGLYISILIFLLIIIIFVIHYFKGKFLPRAIIFFLAELLSIIFIWFYIGWGFNYSNPIMETLEQKLAPYDADSERVFSIQEIEENYTTERLSTETIITELENQAAAIIIKNGNYNPKIHTQCRMLRPGFLLSIGVSGVYWPFVGESNIDDGLHYLPKITTIAHELGHAYGITDEGACNFFSWLVCTHSKYHSIQYAANLSYFRSLLVHAKDRKATIQLLAPAVQADLEAIKLAYKKYPSVIETNWIYDKYLKLFGVDDGIDNYSKVVGMIATYRKDGKLGF